MILDQDNEYTMESIKYVIQKFSDTYLLPAVTATFIALIYFAYKCGRKNIGSKPVSIFNIPYVGDDTKCESSNSNILIESSFPVQMSLPLHLSPVTLNELRKKSLSNKMPPMKENTKFNKKIAKLHNNNPIRRENIYANPIYEVRDKSGGAEDSTNLMKEKKAARDNTSMIYPSRKEFFMNTDSAYKTQAGGDNKYNNTNSADIRKSLVREICLYIISETSVKCGNTSKTFSRDEQGRTIKGCYSLRYLSEDNVVNQVSSTNRSRRKYEISKSKGNNQPINKNLPHKFDFVCADLKTYNYNEELSKKKASTINVENEISTGDPFDNYWQIV